MRLSQLFDQYITEADKGVMEQDYKGFKISVKDDAKGNLSIFIDGIDFTRGDKKLDSVEAGWKEAKRIVDEIDK